MGANGVRAVQHTPVKKMPNLEDLSLRISSPEAAFLQPRGRMCPRERRAPGEQ